MRHQNKVEPLSLLDVLCVTLERNVGIRHLVVLMGITQRHLNVILQIYLTPEHGTKHLVLLFHCPSSVVEKKVTCISDVSLNSRGILHFISIYYFLVASETNESSKVSSVWVVTKQWSKKSLITHNHCLLKRRSKQVDHLHSQIEFQGLILMHRKDFREMIARKKHTRTQTISCPDFFFTRSRLGQLQCQIPDQVHQRPQGRCQ